MININAEELSQKGIGKYYLISEPFKFSIPLPKTIDGKLYGKQFNQTEIIFPKTFLLDINNAYITGDVGLAATDDYLIVDTGIKSDLIPPKKTIQVEKTVGSLVQMWANDNYFHWLLNCMTKASLIDKLGMIDDCDIFLVLSNKWDYEREGYDLILPKTKLPVYSYWWKCDRLLVSSPLANDGITNLDGCNYLRKKLFRKIDNYPEKIVIYRKGRRKIKNEAIYDFLEKEGFIRICCEDLSFREQIDLFSNVKYVVSPHGAGLANIVFCQEGTKILEIMSPCYLNGCFRQLASYVNLDYRLLMAEGDISYEQTQENRCKDMEVDLTKLKESLFIS